MTTEEPQELLVEKKEDGKIWIITLNRPDKRNALTLDMMYDLEDIWKAYQADEESRVAIITGAGDKAFCAGADLFAPPKVQRPGPFRIPAFGPEDVWKPVIAAINGHCIAGGALIAHDCDIRIAAEHAEFGIAEAMRNMPASWIRDLTLHMNIGHCMELVLWGDKRVSAQRAYEMGFYNRVVPADKLMDEAMEWADRMLSLAPRAVWNFKEIIKRGAYMEPKLGRIFGQALEQNLRGMEDGAEAGAAFREKRKPNFKNK
ncbi:MAG: enoyl-CoA hydratase-related protein [Dehalococcoidia bacterium]